MCKTKKNNSCVLGYPTDPSFHPPPSPPTLACFPYKNETLFLRQSLQNLKPNVSSTLKKRFKRPADPIFSAGKRWGREDTRSKPGSLLVYKYNIYLEQGRPSHFIIMQSQNVGLHFKWTCLLNSIRLLNLSSF